jgi:hypothetical protein
MKAADDEAVQMSVEQGEREALVATRVFERVESDQADLGEVPAGGSLEPSRAGAQGVEIASHSEDGLQMSVQYRFQALPLDSSGQAVDPRCQPGQSPCLHQQRHQEQRDHQPDEPEAAGYDREIGRNSAVDLIHSLLRRSGRV